MVHDMSSQHSFSYTVLIILAVFTLFAALATTANTLSSGPVSARSKGRAPAPKRPHGRGRPPWIDDPPRTLTLPGCTCDDSRLSQAGEDIAALVRRMDDQETQSKENKDAIQTLVESNQQLQSKLPGVISENERLARLTRSLRSSSSSLAKTNRQLRIENERLLAERDNLQAAVNQQAHTAVEGHDADPVPAQQRSSLRELNDVIGNREAEMMEMGLFPPVEPSRPREGLDTAGASRTFFSANAGPSSRRSDSEQIATSLLMLNQENTNLARKMEQLEGRLNQRPTTIGSARRLPGPQSRQTPVVTSELDDKISQLERLVLVALQAPSRTSVQTMGRQVGQLPDSRSLPSGPTSRGIPGSVLVAGRMSDDDLDAMANVVESVRNKSPRKSAFSVASTGITIGANGDPRAIEFDHEYVNKGGHFKIRRSRFVCELPGFYYITFTLRSYDGKYLGVALMKNEELQTAVYADSSDRNVMQTQSLLLHLEDGDELWLRNAPSENFAVHSGIHRFVTFSGFLIYKGN